MLLMVAFSLTDGPLSKRCLFVCCNIPHLSGAQVTDVERATVKQLMYGLSYGMGSGRMAAALGVSELKARRMADDFKGSHPALMAWLQVRAWPRWAKG